MKRNVYQYAIIPIILLIFLLPSLPAHGAQASLEELQMAVQNKLEAFDRELTASDRHLLKISSKTQLPPHLQDLYQERQDLILEKKKYDQMLKLKKDFLALPTDHPLHPAEADLLAQTAIETFETSKKEFGMIRPAALNNIFVNMKLKKSGLCWHWARNLQRALAKTTLHTYDFHWVTAYEGKLREHNAIAVYAHGKSFEEGIVLDGWRHAGTPYWGPIKTDHYPWALGEYSEDNQNDQK